MAPGLCGTSELMVTRLEAKERSKVSVQRVTMYYLATSGGPNVAPMEHPLILARTVKEWFEPEGQGR